MLLVGLLQAEGKAKHHSNKNTLIILPRQLKSNIKVPNDTITNIYREEVKLVSVSVVSESETVAVGVSSEGSVWTGVVPATVALSDESVWTGATVGEGVGAGVGGGVGQLPGEGCDKTIRTKQQTETEGTAQTHRGRWG